MDIGTAHLQLVQTYETGPTVTDTARKVEKNEGEEGTVVNMQKHFRFEQIKNALSRLGNLQVIMDPLLDDAGAKLPCEYYIETDDVHAAAMIAQQYDLGIIVVGALTSATNNFGKTTHPNGVIAIRPKRIFNDNELKSTDPKEAINNKSNQLVINRDKLGDDIHTATVGSGLTFGQANEIIQQELGPEYWIPVDLTTVNSALAGAVFATGAQGPSRIKLSEIAVKAKMTDGNRIKNLAGPDLADHEGLIGLTGAITEIEVKVFKRPKNLFGIPLVLKDTKEIPWNEQSAKVLANLHEYTKLNLKKGVISSAKSTDYIDGLEILTREDLELMLEDSTDPEVKREAKKLLASMDANNSNYMLYVTGNATKNIDELTGEVIEGKENIQSHLLQLFEEGVVDIPGTYEGTSNLKIMKNLREAAPDLARNLSRGKAKAESTSLDINVRVKPGISATPEELVGIFAKMLKPFHEYEQEIEHFIKPMAEEQKVSVAVHRYGHMHPNSFDPHTRVTATASEEASSNAVAGIINAVKVFKKRLLENLKELAKIDSRIEILNGEKGKISEPDLLSNATVQKTRKLIAAAGENWNFRAPKNFQSETVN